MKRLVAILVLLVLTLIPESCLRQPPSVEDVESFMEKNWNDIVLVNDYLLKLEDKDAIVNHDGSILIDFVDHQIEDDAVKKALQSLWRNGCKSIVKFVHGKENKNAIIYDIWERTIGDVECGFVYAIDHALPPEVEFQTELTALSKEGWYYYLAEYEKWRVLNKD